jgi:hypothetical protein
VEHFRAGVWIGLIISQLYSQSAKLASPAEASQLAQLLILGDNLEYVTFGLLADKLGLSRIATTTWPLPLQN